MERKLENWLTAYGDWTLPRSEAQESIIIATGLFTVASVLKRKVWFPRELLGSYSLFPNLYIIVVGPQGVVKKSTTLDYAQDLLSNLEGITLTSEAMSWSMLIKVLSETPDHAVSVVSDEFATFVGVTKIEMFDLLTNLYGGRLKHDLETRARGKESVDRPCINLLAATTPTALTSLMPEHVIGGGFASRTLFIYEKEPRRYKLFYDDVDHSELDRIKLRLQHDLMVMAQLEGAFSLESRTVQKEMEDWYQAIAAESPTEARMEGYFNRKHAHLIKLAMILSICESNDLVITKVHFDAAKSILEGFEAKMPRAFAGAGRNPLTRSFDEIKEFISGFNKPVPKGVIMGRFYHSFPSTTDLDEVLRALTIMGEIEPIQVGNGIAYKSTIPLPFLRVVEGSQPIE